MSDKEKFEGFKQDLVNNNEKKYGKEIREKYGDARVNASNNKVKNMTKEQWEDTEALGNEIFALLKVAFEEGSPSCDAAQKACDLHRQWLCRFWEDGMYSKEMHKNLADMYVADERFTEYYDKVAVGCTKLLRDAIYVYCDKAE